MQPCLPFVSPDLPPSSKVVPRSEWRAVPIPSLVALHPKMCTVDFSQSYVGGCANTTSWSLSYLPKLPPVQRIGRHRATPSSHCRRRVTSQLVVPQMCLQSFVHLLTIFLGTGHSSRSHSQAQSLWIPQKGRRH